MTDKEKALHVLREYNLGNPLADLFFQVMGRATGLTIPEMLVKLREIIDNEV